MKKIEEYSHIYKPLMAGLFTGYFATILNLVYDVVFRNYTDFPLHDLINVSTLIFATLFVLPLAGCVLALIEKLFKNSTLIYIILSAVVTVLLIYGVMHVQRSPNPVYNHEFRELLLGIVILTGISATFFVPYFEKHSDVFM